MRLACVLSVVLLGACATAQDSKSPDPPLAAGKAPAPSAEPAATTTTLAAAPSAASAAAASAKAKPAEDGKFDQLDPSNIVEAQAAGYKVVNDKGTTMLCRKDLQTGTRLKYITTCLTKEQWRETTEAARAAVKPGLTAKPYRGN